MRNFWYPECSQQDAGAEVLINLIDWIFEHKRFLGLVFLVIFTLILTTLGNSINFYSKPETFENILIEAHGSLIELIFIGIIFSLYNHKAEKSKNAFQLENLLLSQLNAPKTNFEVYRTQQIIKQILSNGNRRISLDGHYIRGFKLISTDLPLSSFVNADLSNSHFEDNFLVQCRFDEANLEGANFYNCNLEYCSFEGTDLNNTSFFNCEGINNETFERAKPGCKIHISDS
ncbi:MAG: hypothetical protein ACJAS4_001423 [Bacteriovoracaceae bacterium]